ncbi:hypothetical protein FY136_28680 (plasmid) [Agrobacterium tumefaciens]|uniref:hypothetical protein n=1 Tax=Agrobacterium tumefaciens TaxID=358 RepID=UPI0021D1AC71|nr:hypothetical protein [Agrobacterium tumefaciens]UXT53239.1 hypothetical protein FY136_28680 [Agrobacterium tumefaciens]
MSHASDFHARYPECGFDRLPWGIECDDGWLPLLDQCFSSIEAATRSGGTFALRQVKEKMGDLRIYYDLDAAPDVEEAVRQATELASHRSFHVCEICGRRGVLHSFNGLYKVVCEEHAVGELGTGVPFDVSSFQPYGDDPYNPAEDAFLMSRPTVAEFNDAPLLEGWTEIDEGEDWMHGWFFGHPEIHDGTHGHTSAVIQIDEARPPRWVRTDSRLYRLGSYYPPAEREIRYWAQKHSGGALDRGTPPGGSDDVHAMLAFLRSTGRIRGEKIDRMEQAYRQERERLT